MDVYIQHLVGSNSDTQPDSDVLLQSTLSIATVSELSQELGRRLDNSKVQNLKCAGFVACTGLFRGVLKTN
ncbi:hypothetical protein GGF41_007364 [Coemansia sp. RSA 2531]|nr:hypothetical protein GGF41_007364 [Coemansia sp. RSA 2531]